MKKVKVVKIRKLQKDSESSESESESSCSTSQWKSISTIKYKKPKGGTRQDNLTKPEIIEKLDGYIKVKSLSQLEDLVPFKSWVKYIAKDTKKFRTGGLLSKLGYVDNKLTYLTLFNPSMKLTWSVQLANNDIWIPDPKITIEREKEKEREDYIKEKLYSLYLDGKIKITK